MTRLHAAVAALCLVATPGLALAAAQKAPAQKAQKSAAQPMREDAVLEAVVAGDWRAEDKARDKYRHPGESLAFWGLKPGMTVVEIGPGGDAWWTEILAPYAARTGGQYVAGYVDLGAPTVSEAAKKARADFVTRFSDKTRYGSVQVVNFGTTSGLAVPAGSADMILVARAFHNWARTEGQTAKFMAEFHKALKPGGVLAVEQHRAPEGADPKAGTGYVPESYVIEAAKAAGFVLDARSEINANPKDTRDHPFGVWTLPPVRRSAAQGQPADPNFDHTKYDAIGESDRMTLRFRKPAAA
jgi:predicted methyltransferase